MSSRAFTRTTPTTSGRYLYRRIDARQHEYHCVVRIYGDGSREVLTPDGDVIEEWQVCEFAGPFGDGPGS